MVIFRVIFHAFFAAILYESASVGPIERGDDIHKTR